MEQLIDRLNSMSKDNLLLLEGMTPELVERVLAARPFTSEETLLKVEGITPGLLQTWKQSPASDATAAPVKQAGRTGAPSNLPESAAKKTSGAGRVIARIIIALLILAAVAAAAYYGIPYFREKVLNPLESNTSRVGELAATQAADTGRLEADLAALQEELVSLQEKVAELQTQAEAAGESIESHSASLTKLKGLQATLRVDMEEQDSALQASMDEQLTLTRALELLSRNRLYLSQNNYGMARTDVSAARDLLFPLLQTTSADQADGLRVVIERLDMALGNLPAYPVVAVFDVDTAWQLLVDGLPAVPEPVLTPMVNMQTPQPTATPEAPATPLPQQTQQTQPSATP